VRGWFLGWGSVLYLGFVGLVCGAFLTKLFARVVMAMNVMPRVWLGVYFILPCWRVFVWFVVWSFGVCLVWFLFWVLCAIYCCCLLYIYHCFD
jgi:hypothetical protein